MGFASVHVTLVRDTPTYGYTTPDRKTQQDSRTVGHTPYMHTAPYYYIIIITAFYILNWQ